MPKVRANDVDLYYEESGTGPEPLVLIHGWTGSRHNWHAVIASLPLDRFRVFAFDLRGAGRSDRPSSGYTLPQLADDVAAATRNAGLDTFHYAGHSLGGAIGMQLALRHPERLRRLILVAPGPSEGIGVIDPDSAFLEAMLPATENGAAHWEFLREGMAGRPVRAGIAQHHIDAYEPACREHTEQCWEAEQEDFSAALARIDVPTLMVAGDRDFLRDSNLRDTGRIPNCALQVFYRVGHLIPAEAPEALAEVIVDFVEHGAQQPHTAAASSDQPAEELELASADH